MALSNPVTIRRVRGTPREVYGRILTPVALVLAVSRREGTVRRDSVQGAGMGWAWSWPIAVEEERDGKVRVLPIPDKTENALRQMAFVGLAISCLSLALVFLSRWMRHH